jgi:hypothetical protein
MLTVKDSLHGQHSVEVNRADARTLGIIRSAVLRDRITDPVYHLRHESGAFLQGFDEQSGWALVEFWTRDMAKIRPFVDYLNAEIGDSLRPASED